MNKVVVRSLGLLLVLLAGCSNRSASPSEASSAPPVQHHIKHLRYPKNAIRVISDAKLYASTQAFCDQALVEIKRAAASLSGDTANQTSDAEGVSTLAAGSRVVVIGHTMRTCTYEVDGEKHTPIKDWGLTEVVVYGDDGSKRSSGYVEANGFSHT